MGIILPVHTYRQPSVKWTDCMGTPSLIPLIISNSVKHAFECMTKFRIFLVIRRMLEETNIYDIGYMKTVMTQLMIALEYSGHDSIRGNIFEMMSYVDSGEYDDNDKLLLYCYIFDMFTAKCDCILMGTMISCYGRGYAKTVDYLISRLVKKKMKQL